MKSRVWGNKNYGISQGFHSGHKAIDIKLPCGTPLYAPENGKALYSQKDQYDGEWIRFSIKGGYFDITHLKQRKLAKGKSAKAGALIGYSGTTGKSTACHLHFGLNKGGWKEPTDYLLGDPCEEREAWHKNRYDALVVRYNDMKARYVAARDSANELTTQLKVKIGEITHLGGLLTTAKEKLEALTPSYEAEQEKNLELLSENTHLKEKLGQFLVYKQVWDWFVVKIRRLFKRD